MKKHIYTVKDFNGNLIATIHNEKVYDKFIHTNSHEQYLSWREDLMAITCTRACLDYVIEHPEFEANNRIPENVWQMLRKTTIYENQEW